MPQVKTEFKHVFERHGLWDQVRDMPPAVEFGPRVNLGWIQLAAAWGGEAEGRAFIRRAGRNQLATFMGFMAAIGDTVYVNELLAAMGGESAELKMNA